MKLLDINDNPFPDDDLHYKVCVRVRFGFATNAGRQAFHLPVLRKVFALYL